MKKNFWYQIEEIQPNTQNKTTIAYFKDKEKTRKYNSWQIPFKYNITKIPFPKHLDKLILDPNKKFIASFNNGVHLDYFLQTKINKYTIKENNLPFQKKLF